MLAIAKYNLADICWYERQHFCKI